jgi:hypothetical protein
MQTQEYRERIGNRVEITQPTLVYFSTHSLLDTSGLVFLDKHRFVKNFIKEAFMSWHSPDLGIERSAKEQRRLHFTGTVP